jgi:hypothetical protein
LAGCSSFSRVRSWQLLNWAVTALLGRKHHHDLHPAHDNRHSTESMAQTEQGEAEPLSAAEVDPAAVACPCCSDDPVADLEKVRKMAEEMEQLAAAEAAAAAAGAARDEEGGGEAKVDADEQPVDNNNHDEENGLVPASQGGADDASRRKEVENKRLMRMSLNTALAIGCVTY